MQPTSELLFPEIWDNTMISSGANCEKKLEWEFIRNLTPAGQRIHLHAGAAFAGALETTRFAYYRDGKPIPEALGLGLKRLIELYGDADPGETYKTLERMMGALEFYFATWPLDRDHLKPLIRDGIARIEFSFAVPIPEVLHPVTKQPIIYAGRTDMIATHKNGTLFIEDDKTASQLGASWVKQWDMRSQFTGYVWAARSYGYPVQAVVVRGVSILSKSYGSAEAITPRPQWKVDQWYAGLIYKLNRYIAAWQSGVFNQNFSDACASYGSCPYVKLCDTPEPDRWVEGNYVERIWEPLKVVV